MTGRPKAPAKPAPADFRATAATMGRRALGKHYGASEETIYGHRAGGMTIALILAAWAIASLVFGIALGRALRIAGER